GDPHHDGPLRLDARLATQARVHAHVEGLVEDVLLVLFCLAEELFAFLHVHVARRAGAHSAASVPFRGAHLLRRLEDARSHRDIDFEVLLEENDLRHFVTDTAEPFAPLFCSAPSVPRLLFRALPYRALLFRAPPLRGRPFRASSLVSL